MVKNDDQNLFLRPMTSASLGDAKMSEGSVPSPGVSGSFCWCETLQSPPFFPQISSKYRCHHNKSGKFQQSFIISRLSYFNLFFCVWCFFSAAVFFANPWCLLLFDRPHHPKQEPGRVWVQRFKVLWDLTDLSEISFMGSLHEKNVWETKKKRGWGWCLLGYVVMFATICQIQNFPIFCQGFSNYINIYIYMYIFRGLDG